MHRRRCSIRADGQICAAAPSALSELVMDEGSAPWPGGRGRGRCSAATDGRDRAANELPTRPCRPQRRPTSTTDGHIAWLMPSAGKVGGRREDACALFAAVEGDRHHGARTVLPWHGADEHDGHVRAADKALAEAVEEHLPECAAGVRSDAPQLLLAAVQLVEQRRRNRSSRFHPACRRLTKAATNLGQPLRGATTRSGSTTVTNSTLAPAQVVSLDAVATARSLSGVKSTGTTTRSIIVCSSSSARCGSRRSGDRLLRTLVR